MSVTTARWSKVIKATRSPLNKSLWLLDLSCGHSTWVRLNYEPAIGGDYACDACVEEKATT